MKKIGKYRGNDIFTGLMVTFLTMLLPPAVRAEVGLSLQLSQSTLSMEDQIQVQVEVSGLRNSDTPHFDNSDGFTLSEGGRSSQVQIINGQMSSQVVYTYYLTPEKSGEFVVGPAKLKVDGKEYKSNLAKIKVLNSQEKKPAEKSYYITATVDVENPYQRQQVIYKFRFYNRARVANAKLSLPEFTGFWTEKLGEEREYSQNVDGIQWQVTEIRYALFPENEGTYVIPAAKLSLDVVLASRRRRGIQSLFDDTIFSGGRTKRVNLRTEDINIAVRKIPQAPSGQGAVIVGKNVELTAQLPKTNATVGESLTLTVVAEGDGNIWDTNINLPQIKNIKAYADKPITQKNQSNEGLRSKKTFKFAIVPQKEGVFVIPELSIASFNTDTGLLATVKSQAISVNVSGSEQNEELSIVRADKPQANTRKEIEVLGSDLMPEIVELSSFQGASFMTQKDLLFVGFLSSGTPILYVLLLYFRRRQLNLLHDTAYQRRQAAFSNFKSAFKSSSAGNYADLSRIFREYLSDRFNLEGAALTPTDVNRQLAATGLEQSQLEGVIRILTACDHGQYSGGSNSTAQVEEIKARCMELVNEIERKA